MSIRCKAWRRDPLLKAADDLLLRAKRRGRNQVAAFGPPKRALA